jgi:hypothetical protein
MAAEGRVLASGETLGRGFMVGRVIIGAVVIVIVGAVAFLATRNIPAPSAPVEKVIPNDRALHP